MEPGVLSRLVRQQALRLGFDACGYSRAEELTVEARYLEQWLAEGKHGQMDYLARYFDQRIDPRVLVPGARTVISLLKNYYPPQHPGCTDYHIAAYAYGQDYHHVLKERLYSLLQHIEELVGSQVQARVFTDSAPVMERSWAVRAGLGWMGKNTLLLTRTGSWYFLGEIILDVVMDYEAEPVADHCGTCTRCIEACPTQALEPYRMDARRCLSYHTIELKDSVPEEFRDQMEGWAYGCDICQQVCPWTRFATPHTEPAFALTDLLRDATPQLWEELTTSQYRKRLKGSAMLRVKQEKMAENVRLASRSK